jgi:hypothetical protein
MTLPTSLARVRHLVSARWISLRLVRRNAGRIPLFSLLLALLLVGTARDFAQNKASVQVDLSKPRAMFFATSIGTAAEAYDGSVYSPATWQLLQDGGFTNLRYPGNGGIDALYHFSTGAISNPYANDKAPDFGAEKKFPAALPNLEQLGTALVTVNYGSNLDGSGGGEPAEAAAWVAYANGKTDNSQAIGKDSKGNDWKTVGYWASLRAADPLPTDDGLNALRIGHGSPVGIQLWAIGHEPWNNGFYGNDDANEPDLHVGKVPGPKEWKRHSGNKQNGPTAYGQAVVQYVKAMKAVDPSILVGASLKTLNPDNGVGKNWNAEVLKAACGSMDYGVVSMMTGKALERDWKTLDEADLLKNAIGREYGTLAQDLQDKMKSNCPAGHYPQIAIASFGVGAWMPVTHPIAVGLFAANGMATLLETGAFTVMWTPMHSVLMLDDKNNPKAAYYGIKMLHQIVGPGDAFVTASTSSDAVGVHAVKRRDGGLGLLLVSKDVIQGAKINVNISGYNFATSGTRYDFNQATLDSGKGITSAPIGNLGASFTVDMPPAGIVAIVIPKGQ